MNKLRAFTATLTLTLAGAACDARGVTDPAVHPASAPALDGIGMVGGGGRAADGDSAGTTTTPSADSLTVSLPQ